MDSFFKIGSIVEINHKITKSFHIKKGMGVIYCIGNTTQNFPYNTRIFISCEEGKLLEDFIPLNETEFTLTNKPLYKELKEWREEHIVNGEYRE